MVCNWEPEKGLLTIIDLLLLPCPRFTRSGLRIHFCKLITIVCINLNRVLKFPYRNRPKLFSVLIKKNLILYYFIIYQKKIHSIWKTKTRSQKMLHYTAISYSWSRTSSKLPTCLSHTLISLSVPKCLIFLVQEHNKSYISISQQITSVTIPSDQGQWKKKSQWIHFEECSQPTIGAPSIRQIQNENTSQ